MRLADVLGSVDGLSKRFVHYLEAQGHIHPRLIEKRRISRRDYSEDDARRIKAIWTYHRRGFSVQNAVEIVERRERALAYVFLAVPARRWQDVIDLARRHDNVLEASVVYGESEDVILKLFAPDDGDIYGVLGDALRAAAIAGQPTILRVGERSFTRPSGLGKGGAVQAYVLVKASAKQVEIVLEALRGIDGVAEASTVYGETDVICRLVVPDQAALDRLVMREIHSIGAVESTRTFIVVGDLSWRRD